MESKNIFEKDVTEVKKAKMLDIIIQEEWKGEVLVGEGLMKVGNIFY